MDEVVFEYWGLIIEATVNDIVKEVVAAPRVIFRIFVDLSNVQVDIPVLVIPVSGVHVLDAVVVDWLEKS